MISRHHATIKTRLAAGATPSIIMLPTAALLAAISVPMRAFDEVSVVGITLAGAVLAYSAWLFIDSFNPFRRHESYILSDRTLAVVRRGRPTRYLKPKDLAALSPFTDTFKLTDGSAFRAQRLGGENSRTELTTQVVARWYDESCQDLLRDAIEVHQPIVNMGSAMGILACTGAITLMAYGAASANEALSFIGLILFAPALATSGIQEFFSKRGVTIPLEANRHRRRLVPPTRRHVNVLHIPRDRPKLASMAAPYILMALLLAGVIPLVDSLERRFPATPELSKMYNATYTVAAFCGLYLAWRLYQRIVRGDLLTTILISSRTLVVLHPNRRKRRLRRVDCVAWQFCDDSILLRSGEKFQLGALPSIGAVSAALSALRRKWWSHVPDHVWRASPGGPLSDRSVQMSLLIEDYPTQTSNDLGDT